MTKKIEADAISSNQGYPLIIYGREECHLCQQMIAALHELSNRKPLTFQVVDIDSEPELASRYGEKIPVLASALTGQEICHYFLDNAVLDAYLDKFR